jgi:hypothetical protein
MAVRLNITMDEAVYRRLRKATPPRGMSAFIESAVLGRLRPDTETLDAAYAAARREPWRADLEAEWDAAETEGWPR